MSETPVDTQKIDSSKRTWIITSACAGAVGAAATAVPFVSTFQPSERAKAAGAAVEIDIGAMKPGEKVTAEWRGKPVFVRARAMDGSLPFKPENWEANFSLAEFSGVNFYSSFCPSEGNSVY